jgi:hypothetical protein
MDELLFLGRGGGEAEPPATTISNMFQYHSVYHKSHMECPGVEPVFPWYENGGK